MRTALMHRDLTDVMAGASHTIRVLDVQRTHTAPMHKPATWDTTVVFNDHDTKIVMRQHRLTGAVRIKAIPAAESDGLQPEPYEIELMPDVPFPVLIEMLEILK